MNIHDGGYKTLLGNRTIFRQLIETFVDELWVKDLDFLYLAELIEDIPDLGQYGIKCQYLTIAENEFSKETLLKIRNIVSTLFLAEAHYNIDLLIDELLQIFRTEEDRQAISLLINWFRQLAVHGRIESDDFGKVEETCRSVEKTRSMLITAIQKEKMKFYSKALNKVEKTAVMPCNRRLRNCYTFNLHLFQIEIRAELKSCTLEELKALVNPALNAPDLDSFASHVSGIIADKSDTKDNDDAEESADFPDM